MAIHEMRLGQSLLALHAHVETQAKQTADIASKQHFAQVLAKTAPASQSVKVVAEAHAHALRTKVGRRRHVHGEAMGEGGEQTVHESLHEGQYSAAKLAKVQGSVMLSLTSRMGSNKDDDEDKE